MKMRTGLFSVISIGAAFGVMSAPPAAANDDGCKELEATIDTTIVPCVSFCTTGTISGKGALRDATTSFLLLGAAPNPQNPVMSDGLPCMAGGFWCITDYTGVLDITTRKGTLRALDSGTVNFFTGTFVESDQIVAGDRGFFGARGSISIAGTLKPDGSGFTGQMSGSICKGGGDKGD